MTTTTMVERERFDMGRVVQRTFAVLGRNFVPFLLVALVLTGLPQLILGWLQMGRTASALAAGGTAVGAASTMNFAIGNAGWGLLGGLVGLVASSLLQAALVTGTVSDLNGRKLSLGEMISAGLPMILPLIGIALLYGLGLVIGFVLLVVPGLILLTVWAVVLPAAVTERTGVFAAFDRSAALTRGHRWSIFGLLVVVGLALILISGVVMALTGVFTHAGFLPGAVPSVMTPGFVVVSATVRMLQALFSATLIACLYYELRSIKEGVAPQALAQVFA